MKKEAVIMGNHLVIKKEMETRMTMKITIIMVRVVINQTVAHAKVMSSVKIHLSNSKRSCSSSWKFIQPILLGAQE